MSIRYVNPLVDLGPLLLNVEKPARYTGGEYGRQCKKNVLQNDATLKTLIAFPDLYEIGMSNQALRIIYNRLNRLEGIFCDRAFAVAPDFEQLLLEKALPLYGLDTGISLKNVDLLLFTLGYELGITNVFSMLDISGIPLRSSERGGNDPIVIMGGPCVSNPLPYADFIDAFWIGEAEGGFFELASELAEIKKQDGGRSALLKHLTSHQSVWVKGKEKARRAVDIQFSERKNNHAVFPVPSMKVVHNHGAVEIMRGCPNGCRFCHAGYWYRPMRQKDSCLVEKETEAFIRLAGYREITLSSLSSGDYQHLDNLIEKLNGKYQDERISFQLPSLKVSGFSLKLLNKISQVRKSGLTFAVETPLDFWQMALNKTVSGEDIVSILREAKRHGWRVAKFYFMIGLPLKSDMENQEKNCAAEEEEIITFVERMARQTGMRFNINVGTFVPKPHTPFQWAAQMNWEEADKKLFEIKARLKSQGHKVGIQDTFTSLIEGIASRGDERAAVILEDAYRLGCRLDAWSEYFKREAWLNILQKHKVLVDEIMNEKGPEHSLPWSCIDSGITEKYFAREAGKSCAGEVTPVCAGKCANPCGACGDGKKISENITQPDVIAGERNGQPITGKPDPDTYRILFSFAKQGSAVFHPHLGLLEIFSMAFIRAAIPVLYTQGFNPLPRLEIASPLSLGVSARGEIAVIDIEGYFEAEKFKDTLNAFLPEGFEVMEAMNVFIPRGSKKHSVSSLLWGYTYAGCNGNADLIPAREEKSYRQLRTGVTGSIYDLERLAVLAKKNNSGEGESYFRLYRELYPDEPNL